MAHQRTHGISAFLHLLHETPEYTGLADFHARHARVLPNVRTIYRWQRRAQITHYPNIRYKCLGLVRCHVIAPPGLSLPPWVISARYARNGLGPTFLYLECLVPQATLAGFLTAAREAGASAWVTDDPWQELPGGRRTMSASPELDPWERPEDGFPLVVPVAVEALGGQSLDGLWRAIHARLGDRVWQYLPRGVRRLPHNGKRYVRLALERLSAAGLIRQNMIRQQHTDALDLLVIAPLGRDERAEWTARLSTSAADIQLYDGTTTILRVAARMQTLHELLALTERTPAQLYLLTTAVPARFSYEHFDPRTGSWGS